MKRLEITLELIPVAQEMPDADSSVLLFREDWENGCERGYWDGEEWVIESPERTLPANDRPSHWSELPYLSEGRPVESGEGARK